MSADARREEPEVEADPEPEAGASEATAPEADGAAPGDEGDAPAAPGDEPVAPTAEAGPAKAAAPRPSRAQQIEQLLLSFFAIETRGSSAGVFRILFGLLSCWGAFGVWLNLHRFWGDAGLVPFRVVAHDRWIWLSPFSWFPGSEAVLYGHAIVLSVSAVLLTVGAWPRAATLAMAVAHASLQVRNPFLLNSGDRLFMIVAALAALLPLGHRYSVDAWRRRRAGRAPLAPGSIWGQRLVCLQIAYVYLSSALAKLANARWREGMALRDVLASPVFAEQPTYVDSRAILWFLTYSTLVFEVAFPLAVWWRRWRPWLIAWGVAFHGGIDALMIIPIFSAMMCVTYVLYLTDDETEALLARLRRPFARG